MIEAVIGGRTHLFDPDDETSIVASGGEADVFWLVGATDDIKEKARGKRPIFKYFRHDSEAHIRAAVERQEKLPAFPMHLTDAVVKPIAFGYNRQGEIIGLVMGFEDNTTPLDILKTNAFRKDNHVTIWALLEVLRNVRKVIVDVHKDDVIIGDLNDQNFLIRNQDLLALLLDGDSLSYGKWATKSFMAAFICPLIIRTPDASKGIKELRKALGRIRKAQPHTKDTDWYAFCVIVFLLLACIHPYLGGAHNPPPGKPAFQGNARIHMRLSVFDPRVKVPDLETAIPFGHWPPALLEFMQKVFTEDLRCVFPLELLSPDLWIVCPSCNTPHGHAICPKCGAKGVDAKPVSYSTASAKGSGKRVALTVTSQGGEACGVFYADGAYRREDGSIVWQRTYLPEVTALVAGKRTVFCSDSSFVVTSDGMQTAERYETNNLYGRTTVTTNSRHVYWLRGNSLVRDGRRGVTCIESVPFHMTSVWAGESFGVVAVQAGLMTRIMTFDAEKLGWLGVHTLDLELGTVTDMHCIVGDDYAWLTITSKHNGIVTHKCHVFDRNAEPQATATGQGDKTWLSVRAACAVSDKLLVAMAGTGIVQVGIVAQAACVEGVIQGTAQHVTGTDPLVSLCHTNNGLILTTTTTATQI